MESANLGHLHPHDQQQFGSSSIGLPSFHGVDNHHLWSQNFAGAPNSHTSQHLENAVTSSREAQHQKGNQITVPPSINASMFQDVGYQWDNTRPSYNNRNTSQLQRIKEELLSGSFSRYGNPSHLGDLNLHSSNSNTSTHQDQQYVQEINIERHLLKNFNSVPTSELYGYDAKRNPSCGNVHMPSRSGSSRIHPSAIISSLTPSASSLSCSVGIMNMPPMHHTWGNSIEGNFDEPTTVNPALIKGGLPFGSSYIAGLNQDQSSGLCNSQKIPFLNGVTQPKRTSEAFTSTKPPSSSPICKKPRFESRCSMPPFKKHIQVRKEKLGDRIAALQQLVSPFGKTDTASVLMEAIGYIKFLQEQVETLSVPYLKSSTNSSCTSVHGGKKGGDHESDNEPRRDLRSRGLCLVPLSCTSYVADDSTLWSPPNFRPPI